MRVHFAARVVVGLSISSWASAFGCAASKVIALNPEDGAPFPRPLDVVARTTGAEDPLPVKGERLVFTNIAPALGHFVSASLQGWAERHRTQRPGGWELLIEVTRASAVHDHGTFSVDLDADFTLSGEVGRVYLAQTTGHCREAVPAPADDPARVIYACMQRIGHDLAGWIEGVNP